MIDPVASSSSSSLTPLQERARDERYDCILSRFLTDVELMDSVSACLDLKDRRALQHISAALSSNRAPEIDPSAIGALFKDAIGPKFYREYFEGEVGDVPPIPLNFFVAALRDDPRAPGKKIGDTFQLIFIPEYIAINAENYSLPIGNIEDLENITIAKKELKAAVPVDLNHMAVLTAGCLKKGFPTEFHEGSWEKIFEQHGDEHNPSHWSYQRRESTLLGHSYPGQKRVLEIENLEGVPLVDRAFFNLMTYSRFNYCLDTSSCVRTSTLTATHTAEGPVRRPSSLYWRPAEGATLLKLHNDDEFLYYLSIEEAVENFEFSIAVQVPPFPPPVFVPPARKRRLLAKLSDGNDVTMRPLHNS